MSFIEINTTNPAEFHRNPDPKSSECPLCGFKTKPHTRRQIHKRITADECVRYVTRDGTTNPQPMRQNWNIRCAARAAATGLPLPAAAKAAHLTTQALKAIRRRFPEYWNKHYSKARKKFLAGELKKPIVLYYEDDRGLTPEIRRNIRQAVGMLVTGLSHAEVADAMKVTPRTLQTWIDNFPGYTRRCREQALNVAKSILGTISGAGAAPPDPAAFLRQVRKAEEWAKRWLPEDPADPLRKAKLSPEMTLTEFYWSYYRPVCMEARGVKALTMYETEVSLKYWRDFTGDPQVGKITGLECANFVKSLNSLPGKGGEGSISPNTVRKHCKAIQALFDKLAPRGKENRLGTGLLADVPYLELPRARPKPPEDSFTVEEIGRWIEIANSAHLPNIMGIRPGAWWRSLILFCFNSGLRIGTVLELKWSMLEGNCLNVPGEIYKGGNAHRFYLSAHALAAIEPLRNLPGRPEKIFANPYKGQGPLQRIRLKMFKAADIPKTRRFGFHGLRKSAATEIARVNPEGARLLLGHSSLRTTIGHYIHPSLQAEVFQSLPQPVRVKIQTVEIETDI